MGHGALDIWLVFLLLIELLVLLLPVFMPDFGLVEERFSKPCILNPY